MFLKTMTLVALLAPPAWAGAPPSAGDATVPLYFRRALTEADLKGRTLRELNLMRNTIFARAGNPFRKDWLDAYFRAQPWYRPAKAWDAKKLDALDWQNAKAIATHEASLSAPELRRRATEAKARLAAGQDVQATRIELRLLSVRLGEWQEEAAAPIGDRSPLEDPTLLAKQLTKKQLDNMSRRDLRLLRNMVYARHGYRFKSRLLGDYFEGFDWYRPDPKFANSRLSRVDWRNVKLIKSLEHELGGPITDWQHMKDDGWFVAA